MNTQFETKPWIGENYNDGFDGKKILLMGESLYTNCDEEKVIRMVRSFIANGKDKLRRQLARVLVGHTPSSSEERELIYSHVAHNNYIQDYKQTKAIQTLPTGLVESNYPKFRQLLITLQPDVVLLCSKRVYQPLFNIMSDEEGYSTKLHEIMYTDNKKHTIRTWYATISGKQIQFIGTFHPSTPGYDTILWHHLFKSCIKNKEF